MDGTSTLRSGVALLNSKTKEFVDGVSTLKDGTKTLNSGIHEFNKEGIGKITSIAEKTDTLSDKVNALVRLGENYQTFTLKDKKMEANTKFIIVVDSVKAPKEEKNTKNAEEKVTFFDRVKNLFK